MIGDPDAVVTDFDDIHFRFVLAGDAPGAEVGGDDIVPIDSGRLRVDGVTGHLVLPATELFGIDPADGDAAFGHVGMSGFVPTVRFGGPGLDGYDGATSLARTPVRADFLKPFRVRVDGETVQVTIDDFTHAHFAAIAVPEPASWALMTVGFLGAGATLRRRRAASAPA